MMAAPRQLVSYDDLFDNDESADSPQSHQQPADVESDGAETSDVMARADAWDDSELIRAWDSTIADYRKHHADILGDTDQRSSQRELESRVGRWISADSESDRKRKRGSLDEAQSDSDARPHGQEIAEWAAQAEPPQSEEDALHRLNMAWYYIGYYTACYQALRSDGSHNPEARAPATEPAPDSLQDPKS
ncbi:hypothetical protein IWW55_002103 [Coemansia sp. RSA 2706]|nr:hypothetical protein IWW55_002103 [Coemansia sp. RSA 2706]